MINLAEFKEVSKVQAIRLAAAGENAYAFVYRTNDFVPKGLFNLRTIPWIWYQGIIDLLTSEQVNFVVRKEEYE